MSVLFNYMFSNVFYVIVFVVFILSLIESFIVNSYVGTYNEEAFFRHGYNFSMKVTQFYKKHIFGTYFPALMFFVKMISVVAVLFSVTFYLRSISISKEMATLYVYIMMAVLISTTVSHIKALSVEL